MFRGFQSKVPASERRVQDFYDRADHSGKGSPLWLNEHLGYIPIHPFSDDSDILDAINWTSDQCSQVDVYLLIFNDVLFVQMVSAKKASSFSPGLYVRLLTGNLEYVNIYCVVNRTSIERSLFERVVEKLDFDTVTQLKRMAMPNLQKYGDESMVI